jgi:hypothetical protein
VPSFVLRDYGLANQARETDGDGAPSLPIEKGDAKRSAVLKAMAYIDSLKMVVSNQIAFEFRRRGRRLSDS